MTSTPPRSGLPRRVKPYHGETLNSYVQRLQRHTHLAEHRVLTMLGYKPRSMTLWPHVDEGFFSRLSKLTGEPEHRLRHRLSEWTQGPPTAQPPRARIHVDNPGLGCVQCSHLRDGATFTAEITPLEHICPKHRTWARTHSNRPQAGSPAPPEAVAAAQRFGRTRRRRSASEAGAAFNASFEAIDRLLRFPTAPSLDALAATWRHRISQAPTAHPPMLEICFPEVATLAAVLLSNHCTLATRGLHGSLSSIRAIPTARNDFRQITRRFLTINHDGTTAPPRDTIEAVSAHIQRTALIFLYRATRTRNPQRHYPANTVGAAVDALLQNRQQYLNRRQTAASTTRGRSTNAVSSRVTVPDRSTSFAGKYAEHRATPTQATRLPQDGAHVA